MSGHPKRSRLRGEKSVGDQPVLRRHVDMQGEVIKPVGQRRHIHPFGKPKPHHQRLGHRIAGAVLKDGLDAVTLGLDLLKPGCRASSCGKPTPAAMHVHPAMRPGPDPDPVTGPPVGQIVAAFLAGLCVVGDFIGRQTGLRHDLVGRLEEIGCVIIVHRQNLAAAGAGEEHGAGLDGQLIDRHMGDTKIERLTNLVLPAVNRLVLASIDQINRQPPEMMFRLT